LIARRVAALPAPTDRGSAIVTQRRLIARLRDGAPFERDGRDYLIVERAAAACYRSARHRTVESRG